MNASPFGSESPSFGAAIRRLRLPLLALLTVAVVASIFAIQSANRLSGPSVEPESNANAAPQVPSRSPAPPKAKPGQFSQAEWDKRVASLSENAAEVKKKSGEMQLNLEEKRKTWQAAMAQLAEKLPPEMHRSAADVAFRAREPRYRSLFESWNLDAATSDQAFSILREREVQLADQRVQFFKGAVDPTELSKGAKVESQAADRQLADLLGPARWAELTHQEAQMAAEGKLRVEELMRKRSGN